MVHDAHGGTVWSRLTFVLYLNDDFEGGTTTFFSAPVSGALATTTPATTPLLPGKAAPKAVAKAAAAKAKATVVAAARSGGSGSALADSGGAANGDGGGALEARGVRPMRGAVLVFPHGSEGCLLHEGSAVTKCVVINHPGGMGWWWCVLRVSMLVPCRPISLNRMLSPHTPERSAFQHPHHGCTGASST